MENSKLEEIWNRDFPEINGDINVDIKKIPSGKVILYLIKSGIEHNIALPSDNWVKAFKVRLGWSKSKIYTIIKTLLDNKLIVKFGDRKDLILIPDTAIALGSDPKLLENYKKEWFKTTRYIIRKKQIIRDFIKRQF